VDGLRAAERKIGMGLCRVFGLFGVLAFGAACATTPPATSPPIPVAPAPEVPPPTPPAAPANVACRAKAQVCAEYEGVVADLAAKLREKCAAEGGEVMEACPSERIVGTCTASRQAMTVRQHVYRAKTGRETRGLLFDSKRACESKGGTFTAPSASPPPARG
jgi:hypothetical protein